MDSKENRFWKSPPCTYHRSAQKEFIYTLLISLCPIFAAFLGFLFSNQNITALQALIMVIGNGELIIYATTLIAPVIYSTQKDPPVTAKDCFLIPCLVILILGSIFYAFHSVGYIKNDLFRFSLPIAIVALFILYFKEAKPRKVAI